MRVSKSNQKGNKKRVRGTAKVILEMENNLKKKEESSSPHASKVTGNEELETVVVTDVAESSAFKNQKQTNNPKPTSKSKTVRSKLVKKRDEIQTSLMSEPADNLESSENAHDGVSAGSVFGNSDATIPAASTQGSSQSVY